ncbi:MAG: integrase core domain-containing protein, partial [Dehalococcoidia bacterium]
FTGFLNDKRYLIHDRDPLYTAQFTETLAAAGVDCVKLPPKSPNLNAYAERSVRSIKSECLNRMIFFGGRHLRHTIHEYVAHYHAERNHQGIGNQLIDSREMIEATVAPVASRERLGGMLKYYHRAAA